MDGNLFPPPLSGFSSKGSLNDDDRLNDTNRIRVSGQRINVSKLFIPQVNPLTRRFGLPRPSSPWSSTSYAPPPKILKLGIDDDVTSRLSGESYSALPARIVSSSWRNHDSPLIYDRSYQVPDQTYSREKKKTKTSFADKATKIPDVVRSRPSKLSTQSTIRRSASNDTDIILHPQESTIFELGGLGSTENLLKEKDDVSLQGESVLRDGIKRNRKSVILPYVQGDSSSSVRSGAKKSPDSSSSNSVEVELNPFRAPYVTKSRLTSYPTRSHISVGSVKSRTMSDRVIPTVTDQQSRSTVYSRSPRDPSYTETLPVIPEASAYSVASRGTQQPSYISARSRPSVISQRSRSATMAAPGVCPCPPIGGRPCGCIDPVPPAVCCSPKPSFAPPQPSYFGMDEPYSASRVYSTVPSAGTVGPIRSSTLPGRSRSVAFSSPQFYRYSEASMLPDSLSSRGVSSISVPLSENPYVDGVPVGVSASRSRTSSNETIRPGVLQEDIDDGEFKDFYSAPPQTKSEYTLNLSPSTIRRSEMATIPELRAEQSRLSSRSRSFLSSPSAVRSSSSRVMAAPAPSAASTVRSQASRVSRTSGGGSKYSMGNSELYDSSTDTRPSSIVLNDPSKSSGISSRSSRFFGLKSDHSRLSKTSKGRSAVSFPSSSTSILRDTSGVRSKTSRMSGTSRSSSPTSRSKSSRLSFVEEEGEGMSRVKSVDRVLSAVKSTASRLFGGGFRSQSKYSMTPEGNLSRSRSKTSKIQSTPSLSYTDFSSRSTIKQPSTDKFAQSAPNFAVSASQSTASSPSTPSLYEQSRLSIKPSRSQFIPKDCTECVCRPRGPSVMNQSNFRQGVVYSESRPGVVYSESRPGVVRSESRPGVVYSETRPGVVYSESRPGVVYSESRPGVVYSESRPGVVYSETGPEIVYSESRPEVYSETRKSQSMVSSQGLGKSISPVRSKSSHITRSSPSLSSNTTTAPISETRKLSKVWSASEPSLGGKRSSISSATIDPNPSATWGEDDDEDDDEKESFGRRFCAPCYHLPCGLHCCRYMELILLACLVALILFTVPESDTLRAHLERAVLAGAENFTGSEELTTTIPLSNYTRSTIPITEAIESTFSSTLKSALSSTLKSTLSSMLKSTLNPTIKSTLKSTTLPTLKTTTIIKTTGKAYL